MKKTGYLVMFTVAVSLLFAGCGGGDSEEAKGPFFYYVNTEGTDLVKEEAENLDGDREDKIARMLEILQEPTDTIDYKSAFPQNVAVEEWTLEQGVLRLHFTETYQEMEKGTEVLLRAAVVQSLTQIEGVDSVEFYIGDAPLVRKDGKAAGPMTADDFIQNTGSSLHSYQVKDFSLYFADSKGNTLVKEEVSVRYNSNISAEKQIIEQLIQGPDGDEAIPTLPEDTKLLGISVRDGVCYVNFSEEFLQPVDQVDPKLTIYSIVNSITASGSAGKVQILVNGETNLSYQETIDISQPFSMNADLIEEEE